MQSSIQEYQDKIKGLGDLNKKHDIVGCYQNHAGAKVGASFWEIEALLEKADPDYFGTQYDIRHAVVEGGYSWKNGLKLLQGHIKTIVLKDFKKIIAQMRAVVIAITGGKQRDFAGCFIGRHRLY